MNKILISEIFFSIDGEGYHAGRPSIFIRTIGCNLRCNYCDSTYTFQADENSRYMSTDDILNECKKYDCNHITLTGGEPLLNEEFIKELLNKLSDYEVDIETNGSIDLSNYMNFNVTFIMDWKAPSSKMNSLMLESNLSLLREKDIIKIVVRDEDFDEVDKVLESCTKAQVYISPCFGEVTLSKIPEYVIKHSSYKNLACQIQMHKIFWDPNKRGV